MPACLLPPTHLRTVAGCHPWSFSAIKRENPPAHGPLSSGKLWPAWSSGMARRPAEGNSRSAGLSHCPDGPTQVFFVFQDNPKKTAESERGDFYITGDRAHMDTDGYFWFLGRNDDVINSSRSSCLLFPSPSEASWERGCVLEDFVLLFQLPDRAL